MSPSPDAVVRPGLSLILRTGVALCFVGHGCYGIMTKAAWVPYFAVAGLGEPAAWQLMPWIGAMDILIGFLVLVWPTRALFLWAAAWCVWTALLRPLAGQGWPEFFERAGNFGVPLALLVATGRRGGLLARLPEAWEPPAAAARRLELVLRATTFSLLAGHAACALVLNKAALAHHYAVFDASDPAAMMRLVGWFELGLAGAVLVVRHPALLLFVCAWKLATESLMLTSGAPTPFFDFVEHGGSYAAPLALAWLLTAPAAVPSVSRRLHPA